MKCQSKILAECVQEDVLDRQGTLIVTIQFSATLRGTDTGPVCGPITLTFRTLGTRYRAKNSVCFFEGKLFHLVEQTFESLVVARPLPA